MKYIRNILLIIIAISIVFVGCTNKPINTSEPSNSSKDLSKYVVDLNELPEGYTFKYQDKEFSKINKELDLEINNKVEKFYIISAEYEQEYSFINFRKDVKVPISYLIKELKRAHMPIELITPPPQHYSLMIPSSITVELKDMSFEGNDQEVLIKNVFYNDSFTVKTKNFSKKFFFQSFDANTVIDIGDLACYALLKDIKITKQPLGYKIELPNKTADFKVYYTNNKTNRFAVSFKGKDIAYIDNSLNIIPTVFPNHITTYRSNDGHYYSYLEDKYLVVRDINGQLKTRTYFGNFNITCEGLYWSPNNKYIFCTILVSKNPKKDKFYIFDTEENSFTAIGGEAKNCYSNVSWSQDNSKVAFYKVENGYSEDFTGSYFQYDISDNILTEIGGSHRDTIEWVNNEPVLNKLNNGLRLEIYDSTKNEFASKYEGYCDPQYPKDFVGSFIKIYDNRDKELASIDIFKLLEQNNINIPENISFLLPNIETCSDNKYLYLSICWRWVSVEDRMNGILPRINVIGFIDLDTFKLHHIFDVSHLEYFRNRDVYNYMNMYEVDYYLNNAVLFFKGDYVEVFDIESKTTEIYQLPEHKSFKLYKNKFIIFDNHSLKIVDPHKTITILNTDLELNYYYLNKNDVLITTSETTSTYIINTYYIFHLDDYV